MTAAHPMARAWISTGGTGAKNYDEFADDNEITAVVSANPSSALAVEMPHKAPESVGQTFEEALPHAVQRLRQAQAEGLYRQHEDVVAAYRITDADGTPSHGLFAMVDTQEISTSVDEPGRVIRNEDVFVAKVRQRVALIQACDHLLSAVLLVQTENDREFAALLTQVCEQGGVPDVVDHDGSGRTHEVWGVSDPATASQLCELAGAGQLVVADGNHRSLAAQQARLERFMAVITTAPDLSLLPYHRLISSWPSDLPPIEEALRRSGAEVTMITGPVDTPAEGGTIHVYSHGRGYAVRFPDSMGEGSTGEDLAVGDELVGAAVVDTMDHALVERLLLGQILGWEPGDERITYVGGDYSARWLCAAVD
ncbi:MAG: DUF1015 family protein, partial [Ornithinimicrobium sp.]